MSKKVRTIAFQVDDWDFLKEYDRRQQESGVSVKNYFIGLIKADIALHQLQNDAPLQEEPDAPEEMMNLFVKITREQRDTLEAHKNATGETVGKVLNRIIDDFLDHTDSLPEGFEEAFQRYSQNTKLCDTTASGKIPAGTNQELTNYLDSFGGSRNALMATLVELELKEQELAVTQDEDQGISMA